MAGILFALFLILLLLRELAAWNRRLRLKYFFTPLVTITVIILPVISVSLHGIKLYNICVLISLLLALAADTIMMIEEADLLKSGIIFFMGSHLFYVIAFTAGASFRPWNILLILLLLAVNYIHMKKMRVKTGKLFPAVLLYMIIISIMLYFAVTGLNYGIYRKSLCVASGAIMFAISDLILSRNAFIETIPHSTVYTWAFYAPGQFLIALSTL